MPHVIYELEELEDSVTRPVIMGVVKDLLKKFGIPADTFIQYPGNTSSQVAQAGSTLDERNDDARLPADNRFIVTVDEDYPEETGMTQVLNRPDALVFFADRSLDIYMKPIYRLTNYTITVKFRARSKTEADRWKERVFRQIGKTRIGYDHNCTYHYPVPSQFIYVLDHVYKLRQKVSPYNESFKEWIKRSFNENFTVVTNRGGKEPIFAIKETSVGNVGQLDFGGNPPKSDREEGTGVFEASFEYLFYFYKPTAAAMRYPCVIHNQLIPERIRFKSLLPPSPLDYIRQGSLSTDAYSRMWDYNKILKASLDGIPFQVYDDWYPEYEFPRMKMLFRTIILVDEKDPCLIQDLTDLGEYALDEDALNYLRMDPGGVNIPGGSVFRVGLYDGYKLVRNIVIDMTSDLVVRGFQPMGLRNRYHLVVFVTYDLATLTPKAKEILRRNGKFLLKFLHLIAPGLVAQGKLPVLNDAGEMSVSDFNHILHQCTLKRPPTTPISVGDSFTRRVGQYMIQAHRTEGN